MIARRSIQEFIKIQLSNERPLAKHLFDRTTRIERRGKITSKNLLSRPFEEKKGKKENRLSRHTIR